ncbi:phage neck terminator protein [Avibacterium paragallinarum]|uniref:phage neck terminator protein n=1 Tax=Avibacterium paragallinarum TaxID=728 RepID=UPI0006963C87|nr:hypothetical protein [Avibacterium paragallinarum]KAA6208762.1 hypothetical protein F1968_07565 [Avibacterium paragallinarum]RZN74078.1 hypothetical protein EIG77_01045 [Avibacterium paragallinarum]
MVTTTISQLDLVQLRKAIQQALQLPEHSVISGYLPKGQRYPCAFVTVDLLSTEEIGQSRRAFNGKTERITTSCLSTISLSAYGTGAITLVNKLRSVLQSSAMIDAFNAMHCAIIDYSAVRNLTATLGGGYEERGQMDLTLSHQIIIETPLEAIAQVDVATNQQLTKNIRR